VTVRRAAKPVYPDALIEPAEAAKTRQSRTRGPLAIYNETTETTETTAWHRKLHAVPTEHRL